MVEVDYTEPDVRYDLVTGSGSNPYAGLDRFGRVVDLLWEKYSGTPSDLVRLGYGYDRVNNRTYRENQMASSGFDELYAYDGIHRLKDFDRGDLNAGKTAITSPTLEQAWGLDTTGNWTTFDQTVPGDSSQDIAQSRTHNTVNEIVETVGASWVTPAHDKNGNMTYMPQPAEPTEGFTATYDAWNRLVKLQEQQPTCPALIEDAFDGMTSGQNISGRTPSPINNGKTWSESATDDVTSDGLGNMKFKAAGDWATLDTETSDLEVSIVWNSGGADNRFSINARSDASQANRIAMNVRPGTSEVVLQNWVGGVLTDLASVNYTFDTSADHVVRLVCEGTSLKGYIDGALIISATSSAHQSNTYAGVKHNLRTDAAARWRSFEVADCTMDSSSSSSSSSSDESSSSSSSNSISESSSSSSFSNSSSSSSSSSEPLVIEYSYDAQNWRTEKTIGGTTTHFYYSSTWQVLEERVDTSSDPDRQFIWGLRYIDDLILRDRDTTGNGTLDERLYALQDANWNVTAISDDTGAVQERYAYAAYGESAVLTATFGSRALIQLRLGISLHR